MATNISSWNNKLIIARKLLNTIDTHSVDFNHNVRCNAYRASNVPLHYTLDWQDYMLHG